MVDFYGYTYRDRDTGRARCRSYLGDTTLRMKTPITALGEAGPFRSPDGAAGPRVPTLEEPI